MSTRDLAEQLISIDTTSRDSNLEAIDFVADILDQHGIASWRVPSEDGQKANLVATIGDGTTPGVILSAHTDCVPVAGQPWSSDPFTLAERDGRWYGRGTADMKTFIAVVLSAVADFKSARLQSPVHLALSYDEELGGAGARRMVEVMGERGVTAAWCVVGEPTSMRVVTAHKGIYTYRAVATGVEAHSSLAPVAVNAVEYGARLVTAIQELAHDKARRGPFDEGFDIDHTTANAGVISGGTALNIVPGRCEIEYEFRHLPEDDPVAIQDTISAVAESLDEEMRAASPRAGFEIQPKAFMPALNTPPGAAVVGEVQRLAARPGTGKVAYGTEAGLFNDLLHVPAVVCGPGSIRQAHTADEYIAVDQVKACEDFMSRLIERLTSHPA